MNLHIIIFDGVCLFCNASINFILKRDRGDKFVFTPMQSHAAQQLIVDYDIQGMAFIKIYTVNSAIHL